MTRTFNPLLSRKKDIILDSLNYQYIGSGNQLTNVDDLSYNDDGFKDGDVSPEYGYDANGNMILDLNKGISNINYNHLNLPEQVSFNGGKYVKYLYDAAGIKLQKIAGLPDANGNIVETTTDYIGGKHYVNGTLEFFQHVEGRVVVSGGTYAYEFNLTDHLGNVRAGVDASGNVVQRDDYYPFGLTFQSWQMNPPKNLFGFQGQEYQEETGWHQYKWRNADPALGRFFNVDPLAESFYYNSTYAFSENKVISGLELEGLEMIDFRFSTNASYDGNVLENSLAFINNVSGKIFNAPIDVLDNLASEGHALFTQPIGQSTEATIAGFAAMGKGIKKNVSDRWKYHTNTPFSQQWSDTWTWQGWEDPAAFGVSTVSGMAFSKYASFSNLAKTSKISRYISPSVDELTEITVNQYVKGTPLDKFGDYSVYGSKGLDGNTFIYDLSLVELPKEVTRAFGGMRKVLNGIEEQARVLGASKLEIRGYSVINTDLNSFFKKSQGNKLGYEISGGVNRGDDVVVSKVLQQ